MLFSHTIQLFETDPHLVDNCFDAIIALDENMAITFWNYGAENTFGYSAKEATGKNFEKIISPKEFDIKITAIANELLDNVEWRGEIINKKKDDSLIVCLVSISKIKSQNQDYQYLLISRDVSERKEVENLQRLNDILEEQLNSKNLELTNSFERINDAFFSLDKNLCFTRVNKKAAAILARDQASLTSEHIWTVFPGWRPLFASVYARAIASRQYVHMEEYDSQAGKWYRCDLYPSDDGLSVFFRDISEEKMVERRIRESEELYRKIVETAQEGILIINQHNKIVFVNTSFAEMLHCRREDLSGKDFFEFLNEESKILLSTTLTLGQGAVIQNYDITIVTKDGREIWVMLNTSPLFKDDQYSGILAMVMDITERKLREKELNDSHQQLRDLASRLQIVREEERASMAREIHDELGQQLTVLKMDIYWLYKNLPKEYPELTMKVEEILTMVNETLPKIEKKAIELHPSLLHDLGLLAAIEWQNKQFRSRNEAQVFFTSVGSDNYLGDDVALALYRIYQEAMTNVAKHAAASVVNATFIQSEGRVQLTISDNGQGFDITQMDKKKSLGLLSMKERCIVVGGRCEISSYPEKGTVVSVTIPLK